MTHTIEKRTFNTTTLILTDDGGDQARIGFGNNGIGIASGSGDAFHREICRVEGEDLTALRDLLLNFPDEAFPARRESYLVIDDGGDFWISDESAEEGYRMIHHNGGLSRGKHDLDDIINGCGLRSDEPTYCLLDGDGDWWLSESPEVDYAMAPNASGASDLEYVIRTYGINTDEGYSSRVAGVLAAYGIENRGLVDDLLAVVK